MATAVDIARWNLAAGWGPPDAIVATAVALRSGGDENAPGGLYAIGLSGTGAEQARAAHDMWTGRGWSLFPAYRDGGYLLFVPIAGSAVTAALGDKAIDKASEQVAAVGGNVVTQANTVGDTVETFGRIGAWVSDPRAWERIIKVGLGAGVVLVGMFYVWKRTGWDQGMRFFGAVARDAEKGPWSLREQGNNILRNLSWKARPARRATGRAAAPRPRPSSPPPPPPPSKEDVPRGSMDRRPSEWNTSEIPRVRITGRATPRTARPLPGESARPRTGLWRGTS